MFRILRILIFIISCILLFSISACNEDAHDKLIGEWKISPKKTVEFEENQFINDYRKKEMQNFLEFAHMKIKFKNDKIVFITLGEAREKRKYEIIKSNDYILIQTEGKELKMTFINDKEAIFDMTAIMGEGEDLIYYLIKEN